MLDFKFCPRYALRMGDLSQDKAQIDNIRT